MEENGTTERVLCMNFERTIFKVNQVIEGKKK
jgi:hypothetical protein